MSSVVSEKVRTRSDVLYGIERIIRRPYPVQSSLIEFLDDTLRRAGLDDAADVDDRMLLTVFEVYGRVWELPVSMNPVQMVWGTLFVRLAGKLPNRSVWGIINDVVSSELDDDELMDISDEEFIEAILRFDPSVEFQAVDDFHVSVG